ncbi:MAG: tyrosine-type recombinase/integrase [Solirubrobacteraceae bacterium]
MSALEQHLDDYLRLRRGLGYKLQRDGQILPTLIAYVRAAGANTITSPLAIQWASSTGAAPRTMAARLASARGFAAFLQTIDPATEVPPQGVFPTRYQRPAPYLWSGADIRRLLDAAGALEPPLKSATMQALFGLLAVTGMRVGEVVAVGRDDVDLAAGVIRVGEQITKHERARLLPLHPTSVDALRDYARARDRLCPRPSAQTFFVTADGDALDRHAVSRAMKKLTIQLGLRSDVVRPRSHDLRHSFAVRTLIDCQQAGEQVDERIAALSTYLGHVAPSDTYWYLTATPELMERAAQRLDDRYGARP